jgi:hypothetical protein
VLRSNEAAKRRWLLQNIHTTDAGERVGEGTVVRFSGFIINGKYFKTGKATVRA